MREAMTDIETVEFARLVAGDQGALGRLLGGERLSAVTPFRYPGRRGPVVVQLIPGPVPASGARPVSISDGGGVIKSLDDQGLDLSVDMIVSKTVFHAVKDVEGAGIGSGELVLQSDSNALPQDLWRFLQLAAELLGLRHSKYKDALLQLSRRDERTPDLMNW